MMLAQYPGVLFTTAITQAEILYGLELLPQGQRHAALESLVKPILELDFAGHILPFDSEAARMFPQIARGRRASGRPISEFDAQIAAIALGYSAAVATRNAADFAGCGITVLNPWMQE